MYTQTIKKTWLLPAIIMLLMACNKDDIRELRDDLNAQKERIDQLEAAVDAINGDVKTLQDLTAALQKNISIKSYTATSTGYLLTMSDGSSIELKNGAKGTNGKDGADAPTIGVKKDSDGEYYWTLAGQFLLQDGKKLRVTGNNGSNGSHGTNGITPQLKVDTNSNTWLISYDDGKTWATVKDNNGNPVPATGEQGEQGEQGAAGIPGFTISDTDDNMVITYQGNSYVFPKGSEGDNGAAYKMVFVTDKPLNTPIYIIIDANPEDRSKVWIDLNNNEAQDQGEKINDFRGSISTAYYLNVSQTITIYGKVTMLNIGENDLEFLDVSKNAALRDLSCYQNSLTNLDLSKNTVLTSLHCDNNRFTTLDFSKNKALEELDCSGNPLTTLDVSKNTALTQLACYENQLTALDVSKNTALTVLYCQSNQLTALDVSKNTALKEVQCYSNRLTTLDVSKSTALTSLYCYSNRLTALDVSKNKALKLLTCQDNQIKDANMTALINSLPATAYSEADIYDAAGDGNTLPSAAEIKAANKKNWHLYKTDNDISIELVL